MTSLTESSTDTAQDTQNAATAVSENLIEHPRGAEPGKPGRRDAFYFEQKNRLPDAADGKGRGGARYGRTGIIHTPHGDIHTPAFVPVATQAAMKAVLPETMKDLGAQCLLSNAFHLYERPGEQVLDEAGGLAKFMNWNGPTFTDSGGFQVLSLGMFAFDELTTLMNTRGYQERSVERTYRWAQRCVAEHKRLTEERVGKPYQALYGVVQGANYEDLRRHAAEQIASLDFDGVGIGGAIEKRIIGDTCAWICDAMPESRPRHVLGIAAVDDIFACVENGGDTFDCVAPARCGRNGAIFTRGGRYNIKRAQFKHDFGPLEEGCDCYTCTHYSRAYVDHALRAREFNGFTLATIHNEHFFVKLLDDIRASIDGGYFDEFRDETLARFYANGSRG